MSISKSPRQMMINLMYLVLLALLALNVSAEIMNAFLTMDMGIANSNSIVDNTNDRILKSIEKQTKAYRKYRPYYEKAEEARNIAKELDGYIQELRETLVVEAGGPDPEKPERPVRYKDKDITTRLLIEEAKGDELEQKIVEARNRLLTLVEDEAAREKLAAGLPLNIPEIPEDSDKETWARFSFGEMPVIAVLPMFTKLRNDVKTSETAVLNYFFKKSKGEEDIPMDEFEVVVSADKGYVIRGEDYTGEVFLGAYSSTSNNVSVAIDGKTYPVKNGKAEFRLTPGSTGTKTYNAVIKVRNPLTGRVKTYEKKFTYEVGERSVAVSADKMNVMYVGVENPISISAAGINSTSLQVNAAGTNLSKISHGKYVAKPRKPGKATITVSGDGLAPTKFEYRVKPIPDPVLHLGKSTGGRMSPAEFRAHRGPIPLLMNFDFDARCKIRGFELVRLPKNGDAQPVRNQGGTYQGRAKDLIKKADFGDAYFFNDVKVMCPGDEVARTLNGMAFNIK